MSNPATTLPKSDVRGFFEILMPGVFLLLNCLGMLCLLVTALASETQQETVRTFLADPTYGISLVLSAGYLIGVVLRLLKTQLVDSLSGWFLRWTKPKWRNASFVKDPFFYNKWMLDKCRNRLDPAVLAFYERFWAPRAKDDPFVNTTFFNLCKSIINRIDDRSASEVFAAEAMCRFTAGSFYALVAALCLLIIDGVVIVRCFEPRLLWIPAALGVAYILLAAAILREFRLLRCKEVDTVFAACFANAEEFEKSFPVSKAQDNGL